MIEIMKNARIPQECVAWPHLGRTRKVVLGLLLRSFIGLPARRTPQQLPKHFLSLIKISEGEAMIGILMAIPIVVSGDPNVFALPWRFSAVVGLVAVAGAAYALYRVAMATTKGE
jgi:hypothetical protein